MAASPTSETVRLRPAAPADVAALSALKLGCFREAFLEDFAIPYPSADLASFEEESYGEARVATEIADPTHATWVCEATNGMLLAYCHCGPGKLPHPDVTEHSGELYQLYVRRTAQGMGLGKRLLATALDWLAAIYPGPLWIGVWSGNERAQAIYAAHGFVKVGGYDFLVGTHRDAEFILRRG
jgi:ribosomal protein S18 acetylase RimI-like enzyme